MASLIAPLASGINGCPSGTAEIFQRGTSTSAVVYTYDSSRDLLTQVTTHPLDANGAVVRYVTAPVDVVCKDSSGVAQRTFTWEARADAVEVRNAGFTGTLPTGGQGGGGRTDLNTVLTSLYSSLGSLDGKVLVSGQGQNIRDVLSGTAAVFFSVQNTAYGGGAKGNDSTDDTNAIQAAVNACTTAGGGIVWFPPGTYKITDVISVTNQKVWFMGASPSASIIKQYTAAKACLTQDPGFVSGLAFTGAVANTLVVLNNASSTWLNCSFTNNAATSSFNNSSSNQSVVFMGCSFTQSAATGSLFSLTGSGNTFQVVGGTITVPTASSANVVTGVSGNAYFIGVNIVHSAASGTTQFVASIANLTVCFSGCIFNVTGGATLNLSNVAGSPTPTIHEVGNLYPNNPPGSFVAPGQGAVISLGRETIGLRTTGSATSYTPDASRYSLHDVSSSGASFQFANPSPLAGSNNVTPSRQILTLRYKNTTAGAITPTFGTNYKIGTAPSVGASQTATWQFFFDTVGAVWVQIGGNPVAFAA